ncbi:hypothetical protein [Jeotgalibacillus haloalkalitolerans]|uniref:CapR homology domain-containing protein n=1 Tax=Jeotgalibacillus haloalkalitolerans TaxID=3104292 RepID=A0ABU5KLR8_9BACL|nr:hypothetical protein [Jeotgalibacillus sp. HH7-29]MDZ5711660.1 hypothetical protein [Jeotgalibacillus sp. HH7-29]
MAEKRNEKGQFIKGESLKDLTGKKFGRLTVLGLSEKRVGRKTYWDVICECGNKKTLRSDSLQSSTKSCGCLRDEKAALNVVKNHKHKDSGSHLHYLWIRMKQRCYNPKTKRFEDYGGRGISVCEEWRNSYEVFKNWALENGYKEGLSIERNDVNGNYTPENCSWIEHSEQANNRRTTVWVEFQGERLNLMQWSKKLGINYGTLASRYNRSGMRPPELFYPVKR